MDDNNRPALVATPFFPVGLRKLGLLWLATLGLYQLVWFFQHWLHLRDVGGQRVRPGARSLLSLFFVFPLAWQVGKAAERCEAGQRIWALVCAGAWAFLSVWSYMLPQGPLLLLGLAPVIPIVALQSMVNRVNRAQAPEADGNARLTRANLVVVVLGGLLLVVGAMGLFHPDNEVTVEERF